MLSPLQAEAAYRVSTPFQCKWDEADFRIVNLETPLGYPNEHTPIYKAGPNLISAPENIVFLKALRADAASLANNHMGDYGYGAIYETLALLEKNEIKHCGAGKNFADAYLPVVFEKNGLLKFRNCKRCLFNHSERKVLKNTNPIFYLLRKCANALEWSTRIRSQLAPLQKNWQPPRLAGRIFRI